MKIVKGEILIGLDEFVSKLTDEQKAELLETFTIQEIFPAIERQLKHETSSDWWNTNGERDGAKIREFIANIQGLEEEVRKDCKDKLRATESDRDNYRKYYDFYFKMFHHKDLNGENSLFKYVKGCVGYIE